MLTWMPPVHGQEGIVCIRTRMLTTERLVAAGIDEQKLAMTAGDDNWEARRALSKQVRRRERNQNDPAQKQAEARRKRVRRVYFDKEYCDRLRKLASSRDDGIKPALELTPEA